MRQASFGFDANDLVTAVRRIEQILVANSGEDPFEEILKLIFVKLYDEREGSSSPASLFSKAFHSTRTAHHMNELLTTATTRWPGVFDQGTVFKVPTEDLRSCMRPMLRLSLLREDMCVLDAAFEHLLARSAKSSMGQYFTPRHVIDMCVEILQPGPDESILDPACGSGAFLLHSLAWQRSNFGRITNEAHGFDLDFRAVRIAHIISQIAADGQLDITRVNSIDGRNWDEIPLYPRFRECLQSNHTADPEEQSREATGWDKLGALGFDVVMTNPPYAGTITDPEMLRNYELPSLASTGRRRKKIDRDILFLERCVRMLRPGGRLGVILPQGVFCNNSTEYVRNWLLRCCRVLAVVGLHPNTFVPPTGAKTCALFLQKQEVPEEEDYPVFFAVSDRPGKQSSGQLVYEQVRRDGRLVSEISHDLGRIAGAFRAFGASVGLPFGTKGKAPVCDSQWQKGHVSVVSAREVKAAGRLDAEFFHPRLLELGAAMRRCSHGVVADHVAAKIPRHRKQGTSSFLYVDISSVDTELGTALPTEVSNEDAPSRAQFRVKAGDVLVSTVRPSRNTVALVQDGPGMPLVASNGFCVLRPEDVSSEYLFAYCKTRHFRDLLCRFVTASMYPAVSDMDVLHMPIFLADDERRRAVEQDVAEAFACMGKARALLAQAVHSVEEAIEEQLAKR